MPEYGLIPLPSLLSRHDCPHAKYFLRLRYWLFLLENPVCDEEQGNHSTCQWCHNIIESDMSLREGTGVSAGSSSRSKSAVIVTSPKSAAWPIIGSSALLLVDDIRLENNKAGSQFNVILSMILPLCS